MNDFYWGLIIGAVVMFVLMHRPTQDRIRDYVSKWWNSKRKPPPVEKKKKKKTTVKTDPDKILKDHLKGKRARVDTEIR